MRLPGQDTWIRQHPRGNKPGVDARFASSPEEERLAWSVRPDRGDVDCPLLFAAPHPIVLKTLRAATDRAALERTLPAGL